MLISSEGIVLKQHKIANNRRIITLFTKNYGKISAGTSMNEKGKGKSALALRPFTYAEYEIFKNRDSYNINSAQDKKSYYSIGEDLERFDVASKLIDYLDKILEDEQPRPKLFDMTMEFFESITKANGNYETILYSFLVKTLRIQGVMPELSCCVNCGKKLDDFGYDLPNRGRGHKFSVEAGGVLCEDCEIIERERSNALIFKPSFDIIDTILFFAKTPIEKFEKIALKAEVSQEIKSILNKYIDYYLGINVLGDTINWR